MHAKKLDKPATAVLYTHRRNHRDYSSFDSSYSGLRIASCFMVILIGKSPSYQAG